MLALGIWELVIILLLLVMTVGHLVLIVVSLMKLWSTPEDPKIGGISRIIWLIIILIFDVIGPVIFLILWSQEQKKRPHNT